MKKIETIANINGVNLCRENNFYFIKRNDGFIWDMVGTKEEVKEELKRWLREVDYNNEYMKSNEEYFIYVLEKGIEIKPVF